MKIQKKKIIIIQLPSWRYYVLLDFSIFYILGVNMNKEAGEI